MPPQTRDPYAGLPKPEADALRRLDAEEARSRVTGTQQDAQEQADIARRRVAEQDPGYERRRRAAAASATTPPPGVAPNDFWISDEAWNRSAEDQATIYAARRRERQAQAASATTDEQSDAYLRSYLSQPDETAPSSGLPPRQRPRGPRTPQ